MTRPAAAVHKADIVIGNMFVNPTQKERLADFKLAASNHLVNHA
jgi:hypothetical protein